ncbi:unnamed protein product (mitochondrion) [Plasmodiophora brassicae]|uniref:Uncharacterized protein n=1 Tax=Plasmodiophora brassicae TaxID=37360 RepID=A0A3P3Y1K2_PLABS|nr:unnamed protein product [Plasmodiophora brassicae]
MFCGTLCVTVHISRLRRDAKTGVVSPFCSVTLSSWTPAPGCVFIPLGSPVTRRLHSNHEDWIETRYSIET